MAAIQGTHGPITSQEIIRFLQRHNQAVNAEVVMDALTGLADRGVLVPMGAVSYRFHVELLRFWLREHTNFTQIVAQVDWNRAAAGLKSKAEISARTATRRAAVPTRRRTGRSWLWPVALVILLVCVLAAAG